MSEWIETSLQPSSWPFNMPEVETTVPLDLSCGGDICFEMRYAIQGQAAPCEGPDLASEGVYLQYSINGPAGPWITMGYWPPTNGGQASSPFTQWQQYCQLIPPGAQTSAAQPRSPISTAKQVGVMP